MYSSIHAGRAVAAMLIVAFHLSHALAQDKYFGDAAKWLAHIFRAGDVGVPFFFVLSGFVIALAHTRDVGQPRRVWPYLRKRIVRIYPTYLIIFTFAYAGALASPALSAKVPHDALRLIECLALWPRDSHNPQDLTSPVLWVAWSLQYEVYFYALAALAIVSRMAAWVVASVLAIGMAVQQVAPLGAFPWDFVFSPLIALFFLGVGAATLLRRTRWPLRPVVLLVPSAVALALMAVYEAWSGQAAMAPFRYAAFGLCATGLLLGLARLEERGVALARGPIARSLGDASYALYLLHFPIISALCKLTAKWGLTGPLAAAATFAVIFTVCVMASVLFHRAIERPLLQWLNPAKRAQPVPAQAVDATAPGLSQPAESPGQRAA
jgi:exopolysaccharide production protein ExoZ